MSLMNKRIVLGITGSIAAYKSADLVRCLIDAGSDVRVVMTENAKRFITPLTMQALSHHPVHEDLFDVHMEAAMGHISLAKWADLILIAPASADCMASLAEGRADDLLTTLCLATTAPLALAPAMNQAMWRHAMTSAHRMALEAQGVHFLGPTHGSQACGDVGPGRMLEPCDILEKVSALFETSLLSGLRVLVTAGPTHEAIDPVRYITNASSGKMGFALAEAAHAAGATVTVINGPVHIKKPAHLACFAILTAREMHDAVMTHVADCDILIAVAAVGDYRVEKIATQKIHKESATLSLQLIRNPDIAASVGALPEKPFIVGFAMETENLIAHARLKRIQKKMDMIVVNLFSPSSGVGCEDNEVTVISEVNEVALPNMTKHQLARLLIEMIANEYRIKNS